MRLRSRTQVAAVDAGQLPATPSSHPLWHTRPLNVLPDLDCAIGRRPPVGIGQSTLVIASLSQMTTASDFLGHRFRKRQLSSSPCCVRKAKVRFTRLRLADNVNQNAGSGGAPSRTRCANRRILRSVLGPPRAFREQRSAVGYILGKGGFVECSTGRQGRGRECCVG